MIDQVRKQILKSFSGLIFEPVKHEYTLDGLDMMPVSNVIKKFAEAFDAEGQSQRTAAWKGGDPQDYKDAWKLSGDIACATGTRVHDFAERYFYDRRLRPHDNFEKAVISFWKSIPEHVIPLLAESRIYTKAYQYAGTFDNLFYDMKNHGLILTDYKTNKDIYKNYKGKRMLSPFDALLDSPFNKYQLQLSLYQIPFEDVGIKVLERRIIWLKPDATYENLKTKDYTKELRQQLYSKN